MLELTGREIADLGDEDLRILIAYLSEQELSRQGLPISSVTAGGNQNAADGGIDVKISLPATSQTVGFIPRPLTGFQVKKSDMPRGAILEEMRPNGELRESIRQIADAKGAYVIVSAQGSVSETSLRNRQKALADALADHPNAELVKTDFYDRERIATWVRQYPGLVAWVRARIGRPISGWQSYGNWSRGGGIQPETFLVDESSRIVDGTSSEKGPLPLTDGIRRIRDTLSLPRKSARLIGLSGLGKTRLAEALFDPLVGEEALQHPLALYADTSDEPQPSVRDMARHLVETRQRAILVIDNCPPETHRALTAICAGKHSEVSLLTIEYDIRDDEPEGTDVFRLEPASDGVIEELIEKRAVYISPNDRRRIAEFSGGNFRIALAVAQTVRHGESIGAFSDADLFERLFKQRNPDDNSLMHAAEVAALVYSFDGEDCSPDSELARLAALSALNTDQLYAAVAELKARGLVQSRSKWRAVLPHALANRLASQALKRIHPIRVAQAFEASSARLLRSFSRRLGYLHQDQGAHQIVDRWFAEDGVLSDVLNLNDLGHDLLKNVAPVDPASTLRLLELSLNEDVDGEEFAVSELSRAKIARLLRSLAYDDEFFERAAWIMAKYVVAEPEDYNRDSVRQQFFELFQIYLSGTHASPEKRRWFAKKLLDQKHDGLQRVGLKSVGSMLKSHNFMSVNDFVFGARPRDFGWHPASSADVAEWYSRALALLEEIALRSDQRAGEARELLANRLRELWSFSGQWKLLATICRRISDSGPWIEGWIAARTALRYGQELPEKQRVELQRLIEDLKPDNLETLARAYVFSEPWGSLDIGDGEPEGEVSPGDGYRRAFEQAEELGGQLVEAPEILERMLREAACAKKGRTNALGRGLASRASDKSEVWQAIRAALAQCDPDDRNFGVATGFLGKLAETDPELVQGLLDGCVMDDVLSTAYPLLQVAVPLSNRDLERLRRSLGVNGVLIHTYRYLAYGGATDPLPPEGLASFLRELVNKPGGYEVAVDILHMRIFAEKSGHKDESQLPEELADCGRSLLLQCDFNGSERIDYELAELVRWCLSGADGESAARELSRNFLVALRDYRTSAYLYDDVAVALFQTQPVVALDELLSDGFPFATSMAFRLAAATPLAVIEDETLLQWAGSDDTKFEKLGASIPLFERPDEEAANAWSSKFTKLLSAAPEKGKFLRAVGKRLHPSGWSGSLAAILEDRRRLVDDLRNDPDVEVQNWAATAREWLDDRIQAALISERRQDESFE